MNPGRNQNKKIMITTLVIGVMVIVGVLIFFKPRPPVALVPLQPPAVKRPRISRHISPPLGEARTGMKPRPAVQAGSEAHPVSARVTASVDNESFRPADSTTADGNRHQIPGEWLLRFGTLDKLQEFIRLAAGQRGLIILSYDETLLAVRLLSDIGSDLNELLRDLPEAEMITPNYQIYTPDYPSRDTFAGLEGYREFDNNALAWLGVGGENKEWGRGVLVAVLDTGVLPHDALNSNRITSIDLLAESGAATGSYEGHGTAVASIIAADDPYAPGLAPMTDILSIRVLDGNGAGDTFTVAQGIKLAVDRGAQIINMSLGGSENSWLLHDAIEYALAKGVVVVAATGNEGYGQVLYPARYPGVLGVGAVDLNGRVPPFSNGGEGLDLTAPGFGVHTPWSDNQWALFSGTSASSAFVSGAVAYVLSSGGNEMSPQEAASIVQAYSNDGGLPGRDGLYGAGMLNITRLEERDEKYADIAVAGISLPVPDAASVVEIPLVVTLQNRGTVPLGQVSLQLRINGKDEEYEIKNLAAGQSVGVTSAIDVLALHGGQGLEIQASAKTEGVTDRHEDNNNRQVTVALAKPSADENP